MIESERAGGLEIVLDVRGLRTEYGRGPNRVKAVRDVSFRLRRGEKTAIVGESGSGKSALALSLIDLVQPPGQVLAGEVWLNGRDTRRLDRRTRRGVRGKEIALIYQDPLGALNPVRTIGAQIAEALRHHQPKLGRRDARRRAIELLQEVEIPCATRRVDDYPHHYSGGMRQRVMIAIALANDPSVLIADEPTTALDVTTQAQILALLDRLVARRGTAIVLITHDLGIVARFCETVRVMYAGRFVEQASAASLFAKPEHPYTSGLLRCVLRPDRRLESGLIPSIPGGPPNLAQLGQSCAFAPRCERAAGRKDCITRDPDDTVVGEGELSSVVKCHAAAERVPRPKSTVPTP